MKSVSRIRLAGIVGGLSLLGGASVLPAAEPPAAPAPAAPDVPAQLDLRTALNYALEHNYAILQARERIREQEGLIVEVKAQALPNASVNSNYTHNDKEISTASPPNDKSWGINLEVRQVLYAGGGVKAALDAQRIVRESALLDLRATVNAALLQVRTRFYDVLYAREQTKVQEQNVQLLREQLQTAKNRFEAGTVSNFEVLRAEVELANAQPPLISARNLFRTATDQLRQALGYTNVSNENLRKMPEFVGTLDFVPAVYELQPSLDAALLNRPELQRFAKLAQAQEANIDVQKAGYRPTVDLVGGYQVRKANYSNHFDDARRGWLVGVEANWAIFDGRATSGRVAQARSQLNQARLTLNEQTLAVEVEVRSALSSLQEASELAEAAVKVVAQAEESLRLADARYSAGSATQLDVLQARVALTQARNNQLQANYSYNVALATVRKAIGEADTFITPN